MPKLALVMSVPILAGWASSGWCAQQIDGSIRPNFERSVALLQNQLPPRRREEFEMQRTVMDKVPRQEGQRAAAEPGRWAL